MLKETYFKLLKNISPENLVANFFKKNSFKYFENAVAIGKAAIPMINSFNSINNFKKGLAVSPFGGDVPQNTELCISTHPQITEKSVKCADKVIGFLQESEGNTAILLSGGGSALIEKPLDFLSLDEITRINDFLVKSGLPIEEINFFRIHLSGIKGGGLLNYLKGDAICFVLCDVLRDRIDRVSSAPFLAVERNYNLFLDKADKVGLWEVLPYEKREYFKRFVFKSSNKKVSHFIVGSNNTTVDMFFSILEKKGFKGLKLYNFVEKEVEEESGRFFCLIEDFLEKQEDFLVAGGEATVNVRGKGEGGRTLELGLRLIRRFIEHSFLPPVEFLFATTDGLDGNSGCAGIFVSYDVLKEIVKNETVLSIESYLEDSNSKSFFEKYGCLIKTGYTGTNLLDIYSVFKIK